MARKCLVTVLPELLLPAEDDPGWQSHFPLDLRNGFLTRIGQLECFQVEFPCVGSSLCTHVRLPGTSVLWLIQVSVFRGEAHILFYLLVQDYCYLYFSDHLLVVIYKTISNYF